MRPRKRGSAIHVTDGDYLVEVFPLAGYAQRLDRRAVMAEPPQMRLPVKASDVPAVVRELMGMK